MRKARTHEAAPPLPLILSSPEGAYRGTQRSLALLSLLVFLSVSTGSARGDNPPPAALWKALVPRAGRVVLSPIPRAEGEPPLPPEAIRADIAPGVFAAGLQSDGTWLADRLASASTDAVEVRFRLVSSRTVDVVVSGGGKESVRRLVPGVESGAVVRVDARAQGRVLDISAAVGCAIDVLSVTPSTGAEALGGADMPTSGGLARAVERRLREMAAQGVGCAPLDWDLGVALRDQPADGGGSATSTAVQTVAHRGTVVIHVATLAAWQRRLRARADLLERLLPGREGPTANLAQCVRTIDRTRRAIALGDWEAAEARVSEADSALQEVAEALSTALGSVGAVAQPSGRGEFLEDATGAVLVPSEDWLALGAGTDWRAVNRLMSWSDTDTARVRVTIPQESVAIQAKVREQASRAGDLARGIDPYGIRTVLELRRDRALRADHRPRQAWDEFRSDLELACRTMGAAVLDRPQAAGLHVVVPTPMPEDLHAGTPLARSWCDWLEHEYGGEAALAEAWSNYGDAAPSHPLDGTESLANGTVAFPIGDLANDARYSDCRLWWESEAHRIASRLTSALLSAAPGKLMRVDWAPSQAPLRSPLDPWAPVQDRALRARAGIRAVDGGWVDPGATGRPAASILRECTSRTRPRIAVIASLRESALGRSRAPASGAVLTSLGVDADLVQDSVVRDDPLMPGRYKAIVYDTTSLDPKALARISASGLPTLYVGPLEEDRWGHPDYRGARKAMVDERVFLAKVPGSWQEEAPREGATLGAPDANAVVGAIWFEWAHTVTVGEGAADRRWGLRLPGGLDPDVEVWVNGEFAIAGSLRSPPAWGAGGEPFTIPLRAGLIHTGDNAVTARGPRLGLSHEHLMDSDTLECVSVRKLRMAADFGPLKASEEREWFVTPDSARVEDSDLLPDTTVLARDTARGSVLLARRGNNLLWRGTEEVDPNDATTTAVFAAFFAMLGLPCSYPPSPQNLNCIVEEGASGAVVVRLTGDPVEVSLGGNRARVSMDGLTLPWQRVGEDGRVILPVPFGRAGSVFAFGRTELEVRPTGGPLTLEDLDGDIRNPAVIAFGGKATGAGSLVVQVPFPIGWHTTAHVDGVAVIPRVGGATVTLNLSPGTHTFNVRVESPEVEEELTRPESE